MGTLDWHRIFDVGIYFWIFVCRHDKFQDGNKYKRTFDFEDVFIKTKMEMGRNLEKN